MRLKGSALVNTSTPSGYVVAAYTPADCAVPMTGLLVESMNARSTIGDGVSAHDSISTVAKSRLAAVTGRLNFTSSVARNAELGYRKFASSCSWCSHVPSVCSEKFPSGEKKSAVSPDLVVLNGVIVKPACGGGSPLSMSNGTVCGPGSKFATRFRSALAVNVYTADVLTGFPQSVQFVNTNPSRGVAVTVTWLPLL
ncbi:MAG: hypothetical protein L6Q35_06280 [Phycisphaerales bacterium]|nr:hypothetical protein [Phycisphaerales bacterium]